VRSAILLFGIAGLVIVRYPSFIQHNTHSEGDIVAKFDDIITPPLDPERERLQGLDHYYMFPPKNATTNGYPKGILIYLHSCQQSGLEFFILPEHRIIAHDAIQKGMVIFSPTSHNRKSGCFSSEDANGYLDKVVDGFVHKNKLHRLPRVGLGDSSGGAFLSFVHQALKLESMAIYNSPEGYVDTNNEAEVIPTVYLTMSSDGYLSTRMHANTIKLQQMNIPTHLYKVTPRPFTDSLCAARLPELPYEFCQRIFQTIEQDYPNLLDADGFVVEGDVKSVQWQRFFKKLESDYKTISISVSTAQPWLRVTLEQEIQSCHGFHAMTAQFHDEILRFLMSNAKMDDN